MIRKTKIVCTLGPACRAAQILRCLADEGMDVARINFSHGTASENREAIRTIKRLREETGRNIGILQDLSGPKIRTGELPGEGVQLLEDSLLRLTVGGAYRTEEGLLTVPVSYPRLLEDVPTGARILLDDGLLELRAERRTDRGLDCRVVHGGLLASHKGVNFPELILSERAPTAKDLQDLAIGLAEGVDFVALSFVQTAEDIERLKEVIQARRAATPVIAKLERAAALQHLERILEASDAVMVARGDLGIEADLAMIPVYQKQILRQANRHGRPAITATQMLDSMIHHPLPTRAEVTDVANAIYDGSDAIMLSGETAVGAYPVEALRMMRRVADRVEENAGLDRGWLPGGKELPASGAEEAVAGSVCQTAERLAARLIVAQTISGSTARLIARYRPSTPLVAVTPLESTWRELSLVWGVHALLLPRFSEDFLSTTAEVERLVVQRGLARPGDLMVISAGIPAGLAGGTNVMKVQLIGKPKP
jgi:pyruvate kinase